MPTKDQVWMAADRVAERGDPVSQSSVIAELRTKWAREVLKTQGGSPKSVGPHLRDWKATRAYEPRTRQAELPKPVLNPLMDFANAVWDAALAEAQARFDDDRLKAEATIRANDELRVESSILADAAIAIAEELKARNTALEAQNEELHGQVDRLRRRLDHVRSEDYWDRVMQEVYELLPAGGAMSPAEIMMKLRRSTIRGGRLVKEHLDEVMLRKKMDIRVEWDRYFDKRGDDLYGRLPGWNGAIGLREKKLVKGSA